MQFQLQDHTAVVSIDDGKANVVGHAFVDEMLSALDRSIAEAKVLRIEGRSGMLCAGFDLKELQKGAEEAVALVTRGMEMLTRIYSHPQPVITVADGHAVGMGAFLLLASDYRIGTSNDFNVTLPETAIGMGFTPVLMALIRERVASRYQSIAVLQSRPLAPRAALDAGFLDLVVTPEDLDSEVASWEAGASQLPGEVHGRNKEDLRSGALKVMRESLEEGIRL